MPLTVFPVPFSVVAPVIWYVISSVPAQLSEAVIPGIVYVFDATLQNICAAGQVTAGGVLSTIFTVAADSLQAASELAVPAGVTPQAALVI